MKKVTIELARTQNHIQGYGRIVQPYKDSPEILNKIVEWSQDKNISVYSHRVYSVEGEASDRVYAYFADGEKVSEEKYNLLKDDKRGRAYFVCYCELVDYLDIYYQEK